LVLGHITKDNQQLNHIVAKYGPISDVILNVAYDFFSVTNIVNICDRKYDDFVTNVN